MTKKQIPSHDCSDDSFNDPFMQKILDAMAQEERNKLSAERTEQMLKKIKFAVMLNNTSERAKPQMKHKAKKSRFPKEHDMR